MARPNSIELRAELWISLILRVGVSLSLGLILFGIFVTFLHHPQYLSSKADLDPLISLDAQFPHTISSVLNGMAAFRGQAFVTFGLLLLILTPVLRVAISIVVFLEQKDWKFALLTALVLVVLLLSFWLGRVE